MPLRCSCMPGGAVRRSTGFCAAPRRRPAARGYGPRHGRYQTSRRAAGRRGPSPFATRPGPFAMQTAKPEGSDAVVLRAVMNYSGACATKDPKLQTLGVRCLDPACRGLTMPLTCRMRSSIFSSELCSSCASAPRRLGRRVDPSTVTTASRVSSSWMHDRCMHNQRRDT
jgi:hypothetical protein